MVPGFAQGLSVTERFQQTFSVLCRRLANDGVLKILRITFKYQQHINISACRCDPYEK